MPKNKRVTLEEPISDVTSVSRELSECRNRLDERVEENKRNRQVIQDISDQVQKYRTKAAERDALLAGSRLSHHQSLGRLDMTPQSHKSGLYTSVDTSFTEPSLLQISPLHRSSPFMNRSYDLLVDRPHHDTLNVNIDPTMFQQDNQMEEVFNKLKTLMFKNNSLEEVNEMLKAENDAALAANVSLRADVGELTRLLQTLQRDLADEQKRFSGENERSKRRADYEHKLLLQLWKAFLALKKQTRELKTSTVEELEKQSTEFLRCSTALQRAVRDAEAKATRSQMEMLRDRDGIAEDLLIKYEHMVTRNSQVEKENSDKMRQIIQLENTVKKERDEKESAQLTLTRIGQLPELALAEYPNRTRARSVSPGSPISGSNTVKRIKQAIASKTQEVRDMQMKAERAEGTVDRLTRDITRMTREQKEKDDHAKQREEEVKKSEEERQDLARQIKRLEERAEKMEEQRDEALQNVQRTQESIAGVHKSHKEFIEELTGRHREELESRRQRLETDWQSMVDEERSKHTRTREELASLQTEYDRLREEIREEQVKRKSADRESKDKDDVVQRLQEEDSKLRQLIEEIRNQLDERDKELGELRVKYDHNKERERKTKSEITEANHLNEILQDENKSLQEQSAELRDQVNELSSRAEQMQHTEEDLVHQLDDLRTQLDKYEEQEKELRAQLSDAQARADGTNDDLLQSREQLQYQKQLLDQKTQELTISIADKAKLTGEIETLEDSLTNSNHEVASLNAKCAKFEKEIEDKQDDIRQLKQTCDDMRSEAMEKDKAILEKNALLEQMKDKMEELHQELLRIEEKQRKELERVEGGQSEDMQREREEWNAKLREHIADKESLQKRLKESEESYKEAIAQSEELKRKVNETEMRLEQHSEGSVSVEVRLRRELAELREQHADDRLAAEELAKKDTEHHEQIVSELRSEVKVLEEKLAEEREKEHALNKEVENSKKELESYRKNLEALNEELDSLRNLMLQKSHESELEKKQLQGQIVPRPHSRSYAFPPPRPASSSYFYERTETWIEETEVRETKVRGEVDQLRRDRMQMETQMQRVEQLLTQKNEELAELNGILDALNGRIRDMERKESDMRDEIAQLEAHVSELQAIKEKKDELLTEQINKSSELDLKVRELQKDVHMQNLNIEKATEELIEKDEKIENMQHKVEQLELQLADKTAKLESTAELLKKVEGAGKSMVEELKADTDKVTQYRRQNEELKSTTNRLKDEVHHLRTSLEKKTQTSKVALEELLSNYKQAGREAAERDTECQHLKAHLQALSTKLERLERKKTEQEALLAEAEKKSRYLEDTLREYDRGTSQALELTRVPRGGYSTSDLSRDHSYMPGSPSSSVHIPRNSLSSHDVNIPSARDVRSSVEVTLRHLRETVQHLQRDKEQLESRLEESKQNERTSGQRVQEMTSLLDRTERRLADLASEKKALDSRLTSQRQLYLSNEETMRSKEQEFRTLRAKLASAELHVREKESTINTLTAQVDALRAEMLREKTDSAQVISSLKDEVHHLEQHLHTVSTDRNNLQEQLKLLRKDLATYERQIESMEDEDRVLKREFENLKKEDSRNQETIQKLQAQQTHWKNTAASAKKIGDEMTRMAYEEKLIGLQQKFDSLHAKNEQTTADNDKLRQEMRDLQHRLTQFSTRAHEAENQLTQAISERKTAQTHLSALTKLELEWNRLEKELRDEIKQLRKDKLSLTAEVEELKRRLNRSEIEKRETETNRARLDREVVALRKHLSALEEERSKTDDAVRSTLTEKKAMDRSLAAMERENAELYRNCSQLQSQIQQLERDTGTKSVTRVLKDLADLEAKLTRALQEKKQLELVLEQREVNFAHKRKMLEAQLSLLKQQVDAERMRRLELKKENSSKFYHPRGQTPQGRSPFK